MNPSDNLGIFLFLSIISSVDWTGGTLPIIDKKLGLYRVFQDTYSYFDW